VVESELLVVPAPFLVLPATYRALGIGDDHLIEGGEDGPDRHRKTRLRVEECAVGYQDEAAQAVPSTETFKGGGNVCQSFLKKLYPGPMLASQDGQRVNPQRIKLLALR